MGEINFVSDEPKKRRPGYTRDQADVEYTNPQDEQDDDVVQPVPMGTPVRRSPVVTVAQKPVSVQPAPAPRPVSRPAPRPTPQAVAPAPMPTARPVTPVTPAPPTPPQFTNPAYAEPLAVNPSFSLSAAVERTQQPEPKRRPEVTPHPVSTPALPPKPKPVHKKPALSAETNPTDLPAHVPDVNLIPQTPQGSHVTRSTTSRVAELAAVGVVAVLCVGLTYAGLLWYSQHLNEQVATTAAQTAVVRQRLVTLSAERATAEELDQHLSALATLLQQQVVYDRFFDWLESTTLPTVYFKGMNVDATTGSYNATAVAPNFDQLRAQVAAWEQDPRVTEVNMTSATRLSPADGSSTEGATTNASNPAALGAVVFNVEVVLDPELFHRLPL